MIFGQRAHVSRAFEQPVSRILPVLLRGQLGKAEQDDHFRDLKQSNILLNAPVIDSIAGASAVGNTVARYNTIQIDGVWYQLVPLETGNQARYETAELIR